MPAWASCLSFSSGQLPFPKGIFSEQAGVPLSESGVLAGVLSHSKRQRA